MLPSVVGTWAATSCHRREVGEPIYVMRGSSRTAGPLSYHRLHRLLRPGDGTSRGRTISLAPKPLACLTRSCRSYLLAEAELATVDPQAGQDSRKLARQRHPGPPHAPALGDLQC